MENKYRRKKAFTAEHIWRKALSLLLACCFFFALVQGCGTGSEETESVSSEDPDEAEITEEVIDESGSATNGLVDEINARTRSNEGSGVVDLLADRNWTYEEIRSMISSYALPDGDLLNGQPISAEDRERLYASRSLDSLPETGSAELIYGVLCENAAVRSFPTAETIGYSTDTDGFDYFQETMFLAGEGVIILHESEDYLFVQGTNYYGWIKNDAVQRCSYEVLETWLNYTDFAVVTDAYLDVPDLVVTLRMGTRLPCVTDEESEIRVLLPCPDTEADGTLLADGLVMGESSSSDGLRVRTLILPVNSYHIGWLDLTQENILEQAEKLLGTPYGWGDTNEYMDCSSTICTVYRCFGLELPRNTGDMNCTGAEVSDISQWSAEEKRDYINGLPIGTILLMDGHAVLYIGEKELTAEESTEPVILHNVVGYIGPEGTRFDTMCCVETPLDILTRSGGSYLDLLHTCVIFPV